MDSAIETTTMAARVTSIATSTLLPVLSSTVAFMTLPEFQDRFFWALVAGFITSFLLGFGMGSNDVANAFGTSVGSKVLTLRKANIMATIMETAGAVLVGYNVVDTVRKGIVELRLYEEAPQELLVGQVAILGGCTCWLILATLLRLPVSSTHAIVGATLGFTLLMRGNSGIQWSTVVKIAASWFISPVLSGLISSCIYMFVDFAVLRRKDPFKCGLRLMPFFYFICFSFYTFMVVFEGSRVLHLQNIPFWLALTISFTVGTLAMIIYLVILRPLIIRWTKKVNPLPSSGEVSLSNGTAAIQQNFVMAPITRIQINGLPPSTVNGFASNDAKSGNGTAYHSEDRSQPFECSPTGIVRWFFPRKDRKEDQQTLRLFSIIQVVTGCFAGFSHGASDVSHTIAPLVAMLDIYRTMSVYQESDTPLWMMFYGVSGTCLGFWALGHRVMKTVGKKITEINPCNGFSIEFGMAITVLCASKIGIPISSTHCLIGSVMFVGLIKAGEGVDWKVLTNVGLSWVVTLPVSGLFSAAIMFLLNYFLLK